MATSDSVWQIEWREEYAVGVGLFDSQHEHLIKLTNELIGDIQAGGNSNRIAALMEDLVQHTEAHFEYEERFMLHYGYPDYEEHHRSHREFLKEIADTAASIKEHGYHATEEHAHLIAEWFVSHIQMEDMAYKSFFQESGLM